MLETMLLYYKVNTKAKKRRIWNIIIVKDINLLKNLNNIIDLYETKKCLKEGYYINIRFKILNLKEENAKVILG